jgi:hypothetical protein
MTSSTVPDSGLTFPQARIRDFYGNLHRFFFSSLDRPPSPLQNKNASTTAGVLWLAQCWRG